MLILMIGVCWQPLTVFSAPIGEDPKPEKTWERLTYQEKHMGVVINFTLYAQDRATANKAARLAFDRIADLNRKMSDYDPESELRRLSDEHPPGKPARISQDLFEVLSQAEHLSRRTNGAFDVTVGPVVRLWRRARRQRELPDPDRLKEARAVVGYQKVQLDKKHRTATLAQAGMRLDLGGIAKGYAGDAALKVFREQGLSRVMIDAGGDLVLGDAPPGEAGWRIGIAPLEKADGPPSRILEIANAAVATSGDAFQFVEIDGTRYSHIVNPKTGVGLTQRSSVTVIAPTGIQADSLASAVSVLGPQAGLKLIESTRNTETLIIQGDPKKVYESKGFDEYVLDSEER